jgi:hypothetical protein
MQKEDVGFPAVRALLIIRRGGHVDDER